MRSIAVFLSGSPASDLYSLGWKETELARFFGVHCISEFTLTRRME
jgi:hypothetical protein